MVEIPWGFKSPLSHRLMRFLPFFPVVVSFVFLSCARKAEQWFDDFKSFSEVCKTENTEYVINNLKHQAALFGTDLPADFIFAMKSVFEVDEPDVYPKDKKIPPYAVFYDTQDKNNSLFVRRKGWTYCVDAGLSTSLFLPLRKVRY